MRIFDPDKQSDFMKRTLLLVAVLLAAIQPLKADEGMWLPALISQRIADILEQKL